MENDSKLPLSTSSSTVRLISEDGQEFVVSKEVASMSKFVESYLKNADEITTGDLHVKISKVNGRDLTKVLEYCKKHSEKPLSPLSWKHRLDEWDREYCKMDRDSVLGVITAAYYMGVKELVSLACAVVADQIRGKSPEEIRKYFRIEKDFQLDEWVKTQEEVQKLYGRENDYLVSNSASVKAEANETAEASETAEANETEEVNN